MLVSNTLADVVGCFVVKGWSAIWGCPLVMRIDIEFAWLYGLLVQQIEHCTYLN